MASHEALQERQLSVKEVAASRHNSNGELLRPRPIHHRGERDGIVVLAVQNESAVMRVGRDDGNVESRGRGPD